MEREVELSSLDLARLLASIAQRGIEEPLEGVDHTLGSILLNGFKRYRCAWKLGMGKVPYTALGTEQAAAIVNLLRIANHRSLSILEQAAFLEELRRLEPLSVAELGEQLSRSKSWVSMRLGLMAEMSERVREKIFGGDFPVYAYMYTVRQFMRMNGVHKQEVEEFVVAVSGHQRSVREIEQLAQGYFRGPESFREAIRHGYTGRVLDWMRQVPQDPHGCNELERVLLKDLEITQKYMHRVMGKSQNQRLKSPAFQAQAHLLSAGILSRQRAFFDSLRRLHDRSGQAPCGVSAAPGGDEPQRDGAPSGHQP